MVYIQRLDDMTGQLETVDQFDTHREANAMRNEYALSDLAALYYTSRRCCDNWKNDTVGRFWTSDNDL